MYKLIRRASVFSALTSILPIIVSSVPFIFNQEKLQAQSVIPAVDRTGTVVTPNGNQFDITGGQFSQDGSNLFHSFKEFGLSENQIANFLSNPAIQNIFGRVTGGNTSVINGLIQLTGGNSNLFLINPSGIVFGNNASLNVPGDFTATTANGIGFGNNWLNAFGKNDYAILMGKPNSFAFTMSQPGAIINAGNLGVKNGNLTLLGGTVASTGKLESPSGNITVSAVEGENLVRLSQPGSLLSLEIQPISTAKTQPQAWNLSIASLPQMLTGGNANHVTELVRNSNGEVELKGSSLQVNQGDTTVKTLNAQNALLSAQGNLTFLESQLQTTENLTLLAKDTVRVRDSAQNPFIALAGGDFYIKGDRQVDILALNHLDKTPFVSGGDLSLVSDGIISGDAHFASGGKFSILNLQGNGGKFISLYDPIISSEEDVTFGSYTGAALKVESKGSINVEGDIEITSPDSAFLGCTSCSADAQILANEPALILRAGVSELEEPAFNYPFGLNNPPTTVEGTSFNSSGTTTSPPANVTVNGDIITSNFDDEVTVTTGRVIISAPGNITTGNIFADLNTEGSFNNVVGGEVNLNAGGNISTESIDTNINLFTANNVSGGNINLEAGGSIVATNIVSSVAISDESNQVSSGDINLKSGGNIFVEEIRSGAYVGSANDISSGKVNIDSAGDIFVTVIHTDVSVNTSFSSIPFSTLSNNAFGGEINVKADGDIIVPEINSSVGLFATSDNGLAGNINLEAGGNIFTSYIQASVQEGAATNSVAAGNVNITSGEDIIFGSVQTSNLTISGEENIPTGKGGNVRIIADNGTVRGGLYLPIDFTEEEEVVREVELPEWFRLPEELEIDEDELASLRLLELALPNTINTAGEDSSGTVEIRHDGTIENIPFIVGDASVNGTAGAINTGDDIISPTTEFPNAGTVTQGKIGITFNNTPPEVTANPSLNIAEENQPITFSLADIATQVSDTNNDITELQINEITAGGSLKINGSEANSGDIITSEDTLEYTPPANTTGEINAFTIVANDKISVSTPAQISVNVDQTQPQPEPQPQPEEPNLPAPPQSEAPLLLTPDTTFNRTDRLEVDMMMGEVEDSFTNAFKGHLSDVVTVSLKGLAEARDILSEVEKATG
ncbi:MAG: filamentous hemagglutinin N-terminal domain-containing protein, partial [Rivularia sp. (in: cyanobacteria)]